ncbi:MAG TPA: TonB-dependent receptor [Steroidobacteraceae bacterium]|nr:TonB-dependent receptor [Steroidobacteraceae bacterium]
MAALTVQDQISDLSVEELSNLEITSVSKRAERLSDAPTSVFVITAEDIRRSGATNLPDALRLAPSLQVARASANEYTVSARGFNSSSANKLLVLIDGRSVYSPLFSGVFWDVQDVMLEDIERIEVISGPGGTLWGVNAVNGVINVITRSASRTQGGLVAAGGGNREDRASLRYGGTLGAADFRVYATHFDLKNTETRADDVKDDAARQTQVGFRSDWVREGDSFMLKGDAYTGREGQPLPGTLSIQGVQLALGEISVSGGNVTSRWEHSLAGGGGISILAYYDHTERTVPPTFADSQDIVDLQLQFSANPLGAHTVVWGAEYRYGMDHVANSAYVALLPARLDQHWPSLFAQDEIALLRDLRLTLGARLERDDYTGTEFLPTVRLAWKWAPNQLVWSAASRTDRAPSRLDHDTYVPGTPPFVLRGGPGVVSETAEDYELGYRGQITRAASVSATVYHTIYDRLRTQEVDPSFTYIYYANGMQGTTSGVELWGSYQATSSWRWNAGFSRLRQALHLTPYSNDASAVAVTEGANPARWAILRSSLDVGARTQVDVTLRYMGALSLPVVPSYTALDLRLGWQPNPKVDLSITGQNLLGKGHGEFTDVATRTDVKRSVFAKVEIRL